MQIKIKSLENEIELLNTKNKTLKEEIQKGTNLNANDMSVIDHIKGTLVQFLKNVPLTEKNNE